MTARAAFHILTISLALFSVATPLAAQVPWFTSLIPAVGTLQPQSSLPSATAIELELTADLTDLAGNALADPQTLTFTTADSSGGPGAPAISPLPPFYLCANSWSLSGTTTPRAWSAPRAAPRPPRSAPTRPVLSLSRSRWRPTACTVCR